MLLLSLLLLPMKVIAATKKHIFLDRLLRFGRKGLLFGSTQRDAGIEDLFPQFVSLRNEGVLLQDPLCPPPLFLSSQDAVVIYASATPFVEEQQLVCHEVPPFVRLNLSEPAQLAIVVL